MRELIRPILVISVTVSLYHTCFFCIYRDPADTATKPLECEIDLTHLTPLWRLYKTMSERQGPEHTSSHLRALTELFYVAENVSLV